MYFFFDKMFKCIFSLFNFASTKRNFEYSELIIHFFFDKIDNTF